MVGEIDHLADAGHFGKEAKGFLGAEIIEGFQSRVIVVGQRS